MNNTEKTQARRERIRQAEEGRLQETYLERHLQRREQEAQQEILSPPEREEEEIELFISTYASLFLRNPKSVKMQTRTRNLTVRERPAEAAEPVA